MRTIPRLLIFFGSDWGFTCVCLFRRKFRGHNYARQSILGAFRIWSIRISIFSDLFAFSASYNQNVENLEDDVLNV